MKRATAELGRRVSRLESGRSSGLLTKTEAAQLAVLQAEHDARFAGPIDGWSDQLLTEFIHDQCVAGDGRAHRLDELRRRNEGPEQHAADRRRLCQALGVADRVLDDVLDVARSRPAAAPTL